MLTIENLSKSFANRKIIDNFNLELAQGKILAIVGPSGGGKTTLLRCICGLEAMDAGEIKLDGQHLDPTAHQTGENRIGIVFQEFNLFPHLSILDNLLLAPLNVLKRPRAEVVVEALEILAELGLAGKETSYPFQLSGGQKQRVAIARALLMKPKVLCYDEPTSALDPALRDSIGRTLLQLKAEGMTQLVVTHDHEFAEKIADELIEVAPLKK